MVRALPSNIEQLGGVAPAHSGLHVEKVGFASDKRIGVSLLLVVYDAFEQVNGRIFSLGIEEALWFLDGYRKRVLQVSKTDKIDN